MGTALVKIEGVNDKKDTGFYLGKRVCYVYRASKLQQDRQGVKTTCRSIWGRISKSHGNGGTVRAVFDTKCVVVLCCIFSQLASALVGAGAAICKNCSVFQFCPAPMLLRFY